MAGFDEARRTAVMQDLLARLRGQPADLLPFEAVRERLDLRSVVDRGITEVPLDRVVGSLGREREFNRAFLPREEALRERWDDVKDLAEGTAGFPPVELYRVGDAYFVVDGHHRVSVARAIGSPSIEARVKEFVTPVPLGPDDSLEDVVKRTCLAGFLEATGLTPTAAADRSGFAAAAPDEFVTTEPKGYERLLDHIATHRYYLGLAWGRPVRWEEAVASWRDNLHRPVVEAIRESRVLEDFPGRTETDLYLFTMDHLHHLRQRYGEASVPLGRAVKHFALRSKARETALRRLRRWLTKRTARV